MNYKLNRIEQRCLIESISERSFLHVRVVSKGDNVLVGLCGSLSCSGPHPHTHMYVIIYTSLHMYNTQNSNFILAAHFQRKQGKFKCWS